MAARRKYLSNLAANTTNIRRLGVLQEEEVHLKTLSKLIPKYNKIQRAIIAEKTVEEEEREAEETILVLLLSDCDTVEQILLSHKMDLKFISKYTQMSGRAASSYQDGAVIYYEMLREEQIVRKSTLEKIWLQRLDSVSDVSSNLPPPQVSVVNPVVNQSNDVGPQAQCSVWLDAIKMLTFDGICKKWQSFGESFTIVVHEDATLSTAQKMHYLRRALVGDAASILQHVSENGDNYEDASEIIKKRFNNKTSTLNALMKEFHHQKVITSESAEDIRMMLDTSLSIVRSIRSLQVSVEDNWIIFVMFRFLPPETKSLWLRKNYDHSVYPTLEQFNDFLTKRCINLEMNPKVNEGPSNFKAIKPVKPSANKNKLSNMSALKVIKDVSPVCDKISHKFKSHPIVKRLETVRKLKIYVSCIVESQEISECAYLPCKHCNGAHNFWLHDALAVTPNNLNTHPLQIQNGGFFTVIQFQSVLNCGFMERLRNRRVMLKAACFLMFDAQGHSHVRCAFIDEDAQGSFICGSLCVILGLKRDPFNKVVSGVTHQRSNPRFAVEAVIASGLTGKSCSLWCTVVNKVCSDLLKQSVQENDIKFLSGFKLANPLWYKTKRIDVLIGGNLLDNILHDKSYEMSQGIPHLNGSEIGWMLFGNCYRSISREYIAEKYAIACSVSTLASIESHFRKFVNQKTITHDNPVTIEQEEVEQCYVAATKGTEDGRYEESWCLNRNYSDLMNSGRKAMRLLKMVKRISAVDQHLCKEYGQIFKEYIRLGFMDDVPAEEFHQPVCHTPHHCAVHKHAASTNVQVVFNFSSKYDSGVSRSDVMKLDSVVKTELMEINTSEHRDFQRVLHEDSPGSPLVYLHFRAVHFGNRISGYQATRSLNQFAQNKKQKYPRASNDVQRNFYVCDYLLSAHTTREITDVWKQLAGMLHTAKLKMEKLQLSSVEVLQVLNCNHENSKTFEMSRKEVNTLGLTWNPSTNSFRFIVSSNLDLSFAMKRTMLSVMARVFGALVVQAKVLLQEVWRRKLDRSVPIEGVIITEGGGESEWASFIMVQEQGKSFKLENFEYIMEIAKNWSHIEELAAFTVKFDYKKKCDVKNAKDAKFTIVEFRGAGNRLQRICKDSS